MAVQRLSEESRGSCFANAASPGKQVRMMKPLMLDGIAQGASYWFLAGYFVEGLGSPFASYYLIGHWFVSLFGGLNAGSGH